MSATESRGRLLICACCGERIEPGKAHRAVVYEPDESAGKGFRQMRPTRHYCDECIGYVVEAIDELEGARTR